MTAFCPLVALRVDASASIGSGHVMRCLTLADALAERGARCHLLSRAHDGVAETLLHNSPHSVHWLPKASTASDQHPAHANWLACSWQEDAEQCNRLLQDLKPDWLVVDHYGLDARWQQAVAASCQRLMVIDDLADRAHHCQLLLDANLGRQASDYANLIPENCRLLTGSSYALLRPEFSRQRLLMPKLKRRQLNHLLLALGGTDADNISGQVLQALAQCQLPEDLRLTVALGAASRHVESVKQQVTELPYSTRLLVGSRQMAELMAEADLAIGAAGTMSWERCCLGLPTLLLELADNQHFALQALQASGAAWVLDGNKLQQTLTDTLRRLLQEPTQLQAMSNSAAKLVDGRGCQRVVEAMLD